MAITLKWAPQSGLDSIEIYRGSKRLDESAPGAPKATLSGDAVEYVDEDVVENSNYFYTVVAVKAGNRTFSAPRCIPYLSKWGPSDPSSMTPRGDMDAAYLCYLPNNMLVDPAGLWAMVPELAPLTKSTWAHWLKFVYNGKILYVPNVAAPAGTVLATYTQMNNFGLLFGENDPAKLPSWAATGVNHKRIITIGENEYIVRVMRLSEEPFGTFVTRQEQCANSEFHSTIARFSRMSLVGAAALPFAKPRFLHNAAFSNVGPHLFDATKIAECLNTAPEVLSGARNLATNVYFHLVLELVL